MPPPDVSDADVARCVATGWRVRIDEISYAPVGFGSHHWQLTTDVGRLFATVDVAKDGAEVAAALGTAVVLRDQGLDFVHAPMRAVDGAVLRPVVGRYPLAVHRWIDGVAGSDASASYTRETLEMLVSTVNSATG